MNILIIEDERKAAQELKAFLSALKPEWNVAAMLASVEEAISWLSENNPPYLIFSDIQLADGISFEIFEKVKVECPIIFCTAFDEYAIRAFETNGIDYLLKPIDREKLHKAVQKLEKLGSLLGAKTNVYHDLAKLVVQPGTPKTKTILVYQKDKIIPVKYADVAFFYYNEGVVKIVLNNGAAYHVPKILDEIEAEADTTVFYRANRQFLISRSAIVDIEQYFARKLLVKLNQKTPEHIVISKAKASSFLQWLEA